MYHDPLVTRVALPEFLVPPKFRTGKLAADAPQTQLAPKQPVPEAAPLVSAFATAQSNEVWSDGDPSSSSSAAAFLRTAPRAFAVQAWHDAVPCAADRSAFAEDATWLVGAAGSETFWVDAATRISDARCTLERLALSVLHFHAARDAMHTPTAAPQRRFTGAEWWVQVRRSNGPKPRRRRGARVSGSPLDDSARRVDCQRGCPDACHYRDRREGQFVARARGALL